MPTSYTRQACFFVVPRAPLFNYRRCHATNPTITCEKGKRKTYALFHSNTITRLLIGGVTRLST